VDFSHDINSVEEGILKVAKGILAHGVTSFCPTVVSSYPEVYKKACNTNIHYTINIKQ